MHTHAHPMHTQTHTYTPHACVHIPHTHTHTAAHTAPTSPQRPTHPRGLMCPHPHTPHPHTGAMAAACTDHLLSWLPTTESPGPPPPVPPLPHVFLCVWICTRSPSPRTPPRHRGATLAVGTTSLPLWSPPSPHASGPPSSHGGSGGTLCQGQITTMVGGLGGSGGGELARCARPAAPRVPLSGAAG